MSGGLNLKDEAAVILLAAAESPHAIMGAYHKHCRDDGSGMHLYGRPRPGVKEMWTREVTVRSIAAKIKAAGRVSLLYVLDAVDGGHRWEFQVKAVGYEAEMHYMFECPGDLAHYMTKLDASRQAQALGEVSKVRRRKESGRGGRRI